MSLPKRREHFSHNTKASLGTRLNTRECTPSHSLQHACPGERPAGPARFFPRCGPASLKINFIMYPWSHKHSPGFMGLARSDKISFSELVPNLITPRISAGLPLLRGKNSGGTGAMSHELKLSLASWWRMSCCGASAGQRGLGQWARARRSLSVHPPSQSRG